MNLEEALCTELNEISGLNNKISPLYVTEGTAPPYLVYRKSNVKFKKTLMGTTPKRESIYNIFLVTKKYKELQDKTEDITNKFLSFLGRNIGVDGPYIEDVSIELQGDSYESDTDNLRADILLTIKY